MPMSQLGWKSPFEVLFGVKPDYNTLKVMGCLCYTLNHSPLHDKFDPKGIKCIYLSYLNG